MAFSLQLTRKPTLKMKKVCHKAAVEHRKSAKTFSQTFSLSLSFQLPTQAEDDETSALRSSSRNAIKKISARKPKPPQTEVENANFSPSSCVSCLSAAGEVGYEQLLNY